MCNLCAAKVIFSFESCIIPRHYFNLTGEMQLQKLLDEIAGCEWLEVLGEFAGA